LSIALHALILSMLPGTEARTEPLAIHVSLRNIPAPAAAAPAAIQGPPEMPGAPAETPAPPQPIERETVREVIKEVKEVKKPDPPKTPPKPRQPAKPIEQPKIPAPAPKAETAPAESPAPAAAAPSASRASGSGASSGTNLAPSGGTGSAAGGGTIIDVSRLTVTKKISTEYPMISKKRRDQGRVVLIVTIKSGRVTSVRVESSSGHTPLDESASRAVRGWEFDVSGYGETVEARIPFVFELK
jgi:protein TonB